MKPFFFIASLVLGSLTLLNACVNVYDPSLQLNASLVVVSGIITDQPSLQTITLSRSRSSADSTVSTPVTKATVVVLADGAPITVRESETQPGTYTLPADFRGQVGHAYQLRFTTAEGTVYESSVETMKTVPSISRVYDQPHKGLVPVGDTLVPASDILIDYADPADPMNFYLWRWRDYEVQDYCASCRQGRYVLRDVGPVGSGPLEVLGCVLDTTIRSYVYFDYPCRTQCWDIFYSTAIDVFSDVYTNGKAQFGHPVATIPAYTGKSALIAVEQLSLSPNAYRYYKLFADQVQNTGTLADSPPAPIAGNIKNLANPLENVVGYFSAASVATYNYKFSRQKLNVTKFIGLLRAATNRNPNRDVDRSNPIFGAQLPSALCLPSRTRTDLPPEGW